MGTEETTGERVRDAANKTKNAFLQTIPVLLGTIILISISLAAVPTTWYTKVFSGTLLDPVIGAAAGSIAAGNPITSYVIGGELLKGGVTLLAVTAFLLAWVTVGIVQLPAESALLGRRFALLRNGFGFLFAIIIAALTVLTLGALR